MNYKLCFSLASILCKSEAKVNLFFTPKVHS